MITEFHAANFKSWADTGALRMAPLTGLFGTNSSGKSSIFQALLMLKQTVESQDVKRVLHFGDERSHVDLGTYYDVVSRHAVERTLSFSLAWRFREVQRIPDPERQNATLFEVDAMTFRADICGETGRPVVEDFRYSFGGHEFGMSRRTAGDGTRADKYDLVAGDYPVRRVQVRPWPLPAPVKFYGFPNQAVGYYQNTGFLPILALSFESLFSSVAYLGPLRDYPKRSYTWAGERPVDVGRRGELAIPALLAAAAHQRLDWRSLVSAAAQHERSNALRRVDLVPTDAH